MAERQRMTGREIMIGFVVLIPIFVAIFVAAGALNLPIPQWGLSAIGAVIGIFVWFAIIGRLGGKKQ